MEFRNITETKEELIITMKVGEHTVPEGTELKRQDVLNGFVYENRGEAIKYYTNVITNNEGVIEDNNKRIAQMPEGVEHLGEFVEELKKKQSIGKKLSKDMDKVITVWGNRQGLVKNIKSCEETNGLAKLILEELNKLK